jgi:cellulose synthase/poly-beta-1,6-N-acetylglucosamine synthase-like glycosyltransferase
MAFARRPGFFASQRLDVLAPAEPLSSPLARVLGRAEVWLGMAEAVYVSAKEHVRETRATAPRPRAGAILVIVPAHDEEDVIASCIEGLLRQTRRPDLIVIAADNCADRTVEIVRRFRGVTVFETVNNSERKAGALGEAWRRYAGAYEYIVGVDADTVLAPDCIAELEKEMVSNPSTGGLMARYTFNQTLALGFIARFLVRLQRFEFAGWTVDILHRRRRTYVLGGQATMFRAQALMDVTVSRRRRAPWNPAAQVEDMELTWALHEVGWETKISSTARAYVGPMLTLRSLWAQRRKWDEGMVRLLLESGFNRTTSYPWRMQAKMGLDFAIRAILLVLTAVSVSLGTYRWYWMWAIPPVLAIVLNLRTVRRMPHRTFADTLAAVTLIPIEIYLWIRLAVWASSWATVALGIHRDRWAHQYAAERRGTPLAPPSLRRDPLPVFEPATSPASAVTGSLG